MKNALVNKLILVGKNGIESYVLDYKEKWEIGRPSRNNKPDIALYSPVISRKQGYFQNVNGVWFYVDYDSKNGTIYNGQKVEKGFNGNRKPKLIDDGDTFIFGGGDGKKLSDKNIFGLYVTNDLGDNWEIIDVSKYSKIKFEMKEGINVIKKTDDIFFLKRDSAIAIDIGDIVYKIGDIEVIGI